MATYEPSLGINLQHEHDPRNESLTYTGTISLNVYSGVLHTATTINAIGNATINASATGKPGQIIVVSITNDATSNKTITFGTNFKPSGTLTGTTSKTATVTFMSDGTNFYELARTTGL